MSTILTYSGRTIDLLAPEVAQLKLTDIAHSLSNLCRFTGHVSTFYSVAEHSVYCSRIVEPQDALCALLHDATEAYLGDVSSPLKRLLPNYKVLEDAMWSAIAFRFKLPLTMPAAVKHADMVMLATERRDLMPDSAEIWTDLGGITPLATRICPMSPALAEHKFIGRYIELTAGHAGTSSYLQEPKHA